MAKFSKQSEGYPWKYKSLGGVVRVDIRSGEDIAHLGELDPKYWTVLSCPTENLEFDSKTLAYLDADADGKSRIEEVKAAASSLTSLIVDKDSILQGSDTLEISNIDTSTEHGALMASSARRILSNLGLEKDSITLADAEDSAAIFAATVSNGDGVITPSSAGDDAASASVIQAVMDCIGCVQDRSGEAGVDEAKLNDFFAACADYAAWQDALLADKKAILPYADTPAALAACDALRAKIDDYFVRCSLIAFNEGCSAPLDVSVEKIGAIADRNLCDCTAEIASCPLAHPAADGILKYEGINPAWKAQFAALRSLILDVLYPDAEGISQSQWEAAIATLAPYAAWAGAKKGAAVEGLGIDKVREILRGDSKDKILALIAADKAVEPEAKAIADVSRLLHLYRDFYRFLRNYVSMADLYDPAEKTVYQAGRLYIDERCCEMCIRVSDMGGHGDMASLSGIFLIYCKCTSKTLGKTMDIVAVMTDGKTAGLRVGKNATFYDRNGEGWEAVVTKIVDNPINLRQAFWQPYRKLANFVSDKINKNAAARESAVTSSMQSAADNISASSAEGGAAAAPKPSFDIAKFAGIFAAIGMALGMIGEFCVKLIAGVTTTPVWKTLLVIAGLMLCISGPSCFLAWGKLRRRNLGPVLNANGWAINSTILVSILFGKTLTSVARLPRLELVDAASRKKKSARKWWTALFVVLILAAAVAALYFTGKLDFLFA